MIRVTVELHSAITGRTTLLGVAEIANDGNTSRQTQMRFGSYDVKLDDDEGSLEDYEVKLSKRQPKQRETWKRGRVDGFNRRQKGAWDLLYLALRNLVGDRNP